MRGLGKHIGRGVEGEAPHQFFFCCQMDEIFFDKHFFESGHIYMKDAEYTETNEKSFFQFLQSLVFEIWSFL